MEDNCNYFYLDAEHKISSIFFLCFAEKNSHLGTENVAPKDVIASQRKDSCSLCVKQVDFQSHGRGTESNIL